MATDTKKSSKSESLTIRLNPRTRFVLEFVARMKGQTITTVVERALEAAGDQAKIETEFDSDRTWKDFWDVSEGVRALRIAREPELYPTYDEEIKAKFAEQFWEYFYTDQRMDLPHRVYVDLLWPKMDDILKAHENDKHTDYFSAEKLMRRILIEAQVTPPKSRSGVKDEKPNYDLDDDIPF